MQYPRLMFFLCFLSLGVWSCKDEEPSFESLAGSWEYSSPEKDLTMTFDLVPKDAMEYSLQNVKVKVGNYSYPADGNATESAEIVLGEEYPQKILAFSFVRVHTVYDYQISLTSIVPNDRKTEMTAGLVYFSYYDHEKLVIAGNQIMQDTKIYRKK